MITKSSFVDLDIADGLSLILGRLPMVEVLIGEYHGLLVARHGCGGILGVSQRTGVCRPFAVPTVFPGLRSPFLLGGGARGAAIIPSHWGKLRTTDFKASLLFVPDARIEHTLSWIGPDVTW